MGTHPDTLCNLIAHLVLLKRTGELKETTTRPCLGRWLRHNGTGIEILPTDAVWEHTCGAWTATTQTMRYA
eukprot:2934315-Lingulodinium_polyedra.AAC.1